MNQTQSQYGSINREKSAQFRRMLGSAELEFIMEAHNGLSARIVQDAGFKGIWASGLTISAQLGVRDSNEASWTQVLEVVEFMADMASIPIMLDGDTGYGNFNNFRRLVRKLEQRGVSAVCIEDKLFPKTNSFIGEAQPLADIDEFCGKIKAGKDSQSDENFSIVARVEALISGWGMGEALKRAEAYRAAGADAILIHSKIAKPDEILTFAREWANRCPVIIVPTMYYSTPTDRFREVDISLIIWANHNLRAAVTAMQRVTRRIFEAQTLVDIEGEVASVRDVFKLAGNEELEKAESLYLAARDDNLRAIVLAAGRGEGFDDLTVDRPKCMIDVQGRPLLHRLVDSLNNVGVRRVSVVRGYKADAITAAGVKFVDNPEWQDTGEAASLEVALSEIQGETIVCFGDILMRRYILDLCLEAEGDIVLVVDRQKDLVRSHAVDLVRCASPVKPDVFGSDEGDVLSAGADVTPETASGRWIGLARFSRAGSAALAAELQAIKQSGELRKVDMLSVIERLRQKGAQVKAVYVSGHWIDVNGIADLVAANRFLSQEL
jgi:phosphoenolpyruvate phosphomutase